MLSTAASATTLSCSVKDLTGIPSSYSVEVEIPSGQVTLIIEETGQPDAYRIKSATEARIKFEQKPGDFGSLNRANGRIDRYFYLTDRRTGARVNASEHGQCRVSQKQF
jgi:hypothetical protein